MNSPFNMPDEYVQGFFKAGQSMLQALTPTAGSAEAAAAPAQGAPLAELQMNYLQQQLALWARVMSGPGGSEPWSHPNAETGASTPPNGVTTRRTAC